MEKLSSEQRAGRALRHLIKENYSSQQEFADAFNTELRNVQRYLRGFRDLRLLDQLADHFDVPPSYFLTYDG